LAQLAHSLAHMALVSLDWTHILVHETLGHLISILQCTHTQSYHKWAVTWNNDREMEQLSSDKVSDFQTINLYSRFRSILGTGLSWGGVMFCLSTGQVGCLESHSWMQAEQNACSQLGAWNEKSIKSIIFSLLKLYCYCSFWKQTVITCNGFSSTELQIGQSNSSSTSPWNRFISIPIFLG